MAALLRPHLLRGKTRGRPPKKSKAVPGDGKQRRVPRAQLHRRKPAHPAKHNSHRTQTNMKRTGHETARGSQPHGASAQRSAVTQATEKSTGGPLVTQHLRNPAKSPCCCLPRWSSGGGQHYARNRPSRAAHTQHYRSQHNRSPAGGLCTYFIKGAQESRYTWVWWRPHAWEAERLESCSRLPSGIG
ncbi:Hypothetical predicted protein [Pelobates cultripes]|uniref:Uncharacterized protein n=1 Tax=Pelobates cultripes TaxID=61616 RepID=A0AAD1VQ91_PELCU|nr:Hypothetical predicted protein [Pelobates cultripes]